RFRRTSRSSSSRTSAACSAPGPPISTSPPLRRNRRHSRATSDVRTVHATRPRPPLSRRGALLFAAMCVIWGVPYLMIRVAVRELAPGTLLFLRTGLAALLLVPLAAQRRELRPLLAHWRPLLAYTGIEVALPWFLLSRAETQL